MNHSPSDILVEALLTVEGLSPGAASSKDWGIYVNQLPVRPLNAIGVFDVEGRLQGRIQRTGSMVEFPGFTVLIRAEKYNPGWKKANAVKEALDAILKAEVTLDGEGYTLESVTRSSNVIATGRDPKDEYDQFSINGTVTV